MNTNNQNNNQKTTSPINQTIANNNISINQTTKPQPQVSVQMPNTQQANITNNNIATNNIPSNQMPFPSTYSQNSSLQTMTQNQNIKVNREQPIYNNQIQTPQSNNTQQPAAPKPNPLRKFFLILVFIGLLIAAIGGGLLVYDNYQYKNYTITSADLVDSNKTEKNGVTYYTGNYKYKIDKKEYFYTTKELTIQMPSQVIQVKYNPENPAKIYESSLSKLFFVILFSGLGLSFVSGLIAIALTSSNLKEMIIVEVIEQVTCVGGKRIYMHNINIAPETEEAKTAKYYIYFTKDTQKFAIGNKLTFNIYQYGEVFTTEKYKNIIGRTVYNFKDEDFTIIEVARK